VSNNPKPPAEPPDEQALAYMSKVDDAVVEQIAMAQVKGQKVPAFLLLPPPPRPYDRHLIHAYIPYIFTDQFAGERIPEIRFATSEGPDSVH